MKKTPHTASSTAPPLHVALLHTDLGTLLAVWSDGGLCLLWPVGSREQARAVLQQRFPTYSFIPADEHSTPVQTLCRHLEQPLQTPCPALDLRGTAFQRQVWQALQQIPAGQTLSYSELACQIGRPRACRAVAAACAANPVAVLVPCHRVLRSDGQLGGYRWGLRMKQRLLTHESTTERMFGYKISNIDTAFTAEIATNTNLY